MHDDRNPRKHVPSIMPPFSRVARAESLPPLHLTRSDFARLEHLLATYARARPSRAAEILGRELARARVVERGEIPLTDAERKALIESAAKVAKGVAEVEAMNVAA